MLDLSSDIAVLAATVYGEARGEPDLGKIAVACVVLNRVAIARAAGRAQFGDGTVRGACLAREQFSCWNRGDPNRARLLALQFDDTGDPVWAACRAAARRVQNAAVTDPTQGATFYKVSTRAWPRDWGPEVTPLAVIGRHSFYRIP